MKKQVLINVEDKDIRVALLENGELVQLFVEKIDDKTIVGNIYKGRVASIVPGLRAAFVDVGLERNAFLHFSDIHRDYILPKGGEPQRRAPDGSSSSAGGNGGASGAESQAREPLAMGSPQRTGKGQRKGVAELQVGDELLVQAAKEPISTKGARVTTYISLPGRFLVFLPNSDREKSGGISRRIESATERRRLRAILKAFDADEGNFIIRTAGLSQEEQAISADVQVLKKSWTRIKRSAAQRTAPALVHDDHDILGRLVRDELSEDMDEIIIDSATHARTLRQMLASIIPNLKKEVILYGNIEENLFDKYEVENQFQKALRRVVRLKCGGYIVMDEAEALVVIDVNTGKFVGKGDQEEMISQTNVEAAQAIARQLRLRDVGGIIVIDFIDMRSRENQRNLVRKFKEYLHRDRAKCFVGQLSELGLLEMTRKRVRESLSKALFDECPHCRGSGQVLAPAQVWKNLKYEILDFLKNDRGIRNLQITTHPEIRRYVEMEMLEAAGNVANYGRVALNFVDNKDYHMEHFKIVKC